MLNKYDLSEFENNQILIIYRHNDNLYSWSGTKLDCLSFDDLIQAGKESIKDLLVFKRN